MPANFVLTLDTTGPAGVEFELANGAVNVATQDVNLHTVTTDPDTTGYQMKYWGDADGHPTEELVAWEAFQADRTLALSNGDGLKTVYLRLRDDVGNESVAVSHTITVDTTVPTITITIDPAPVKISKIAGWDVSTFSFASDQDLQAWMVRVVPDGNASWMEGTQIPVDGGSTNTSGGALVANTGQQVTINGADLETASPGDGDKAVKVFGQDAQGQWST